MIIPNILSTQLKMAFVSIAIVIRRNDGTVASINGRRGTRWFLGNAV